MCDGNLSIGLTLGAEALHGTRAAAETQGRIVHREVGLAPEIGATAPDLVEVEGFTKEVIGREAVAKAADVVATTLRTKNGTVAAVVTKVSKRAKAPAAAAVRAPETEREATVQAADTSIIEIAEAGQISEEEVATDSAAAAEGDMETELEAMTSEEVVASGVT